MPVLSDAEAWITVADLTGTILLLLGKVMLVVGAIVSPVAWPTVYETVAAKGELSALPVAVTVQKNSPWLDGASTATDKEMLDPG